MGFSFKKAFKKVANAATSFTTLGAVNAFGGMFTDKSSPAAQLGAQAGIHTAAVTSASKQLDAAQASAQASADAAKRQAEYEEQAARGAELVKARRRRGYSSTLLAGGGSSLGNYGATGSLLGG